MATGFDLQGLGRVLAALAAAFFLRSIAGPGPAIGPAAEEESPEDDASAGGGEGDEEAPASGGVPPVSIRWSGITCALSDKKGKTVRFLLKNVTGEATPGRLLALMGPSGSGKTTLLNVLAGQLTFSPRLHLSGQLTVNGRPMSQQWFKSAYLRQEDLFFSQLTVCETLSLAAELQLPNSMSAEKRDEYVNELLFRMGLTNCADSIVGDAKVRGISGGEKKRLSLACELIASPSVIFADEPTTGLDAFQAEKVMETLRQLAEDGHTVICSIHQPRGSVYDKFDDLVLLSEGAVVYMGPAKDEALAHFESFGYRCPDHVNPAEFLADLISIDYSSTENVYISRKRIDDLVEAFSTISSILQPSSASMEFEGSKISSKLGRKSIVKKKGGWWRQFWLLLKRAWMQASRDGPTNKVRTRMSVASALIFGSVFWRMGRNQTSIQDRMGLLQVAAINTAMAALTKTVGVFPKERAIVDRERAKSSYSLGPYLLSKLLAEIPIGAAFPLMFGTILYPMAHLHPTISRSSFALSLPIIQVAAINTAMAALTKTVGVFPKERAIVDRERAKSSYSLGPYLLSKLLAEIPIGAAFPLMFGTILYPMAHLHPTISRSSFALSLPIIQGTYQSAISYTMTFCISVNLLYSLTSHKAFYFRFAKFCGIVTVESFAASAMGLTVGAMVPSTEAAMAVGPSLMTVFIVFGGYYVNADNTPLIFRWIPRVSLIRWAFQGLCINEFRGLQFEQQQSFDLQTGEQVLERLSFGGSSIKDTVIAQGRILMFWYWTTYLLLKKNKPKYQQLDSPSPPLELA